MVKRTKDPNMPKRALSAFFCFCAEERPKVKAIHPDWGVADVAKELGKRWGDLKNKTKYEGQAQADKQRYEKDMVKYNAGKGGKKAGGDSGSPSKKRRTDD